jgi:predicted nucleic acid-binding protein
MKYVLDASVALRWVIPGPLSARANQLCNDYLHKVHDLLAPDIFPGETASALTKAERQKLIQVGQAAPAVREDCRRMAFLAGVPSPDWAGPGYLVADAEWFLRPPLRGPGRT